MQEPKKKRVMLPARPDTSILVQAAQTTKLLEGKYDAEDEEKAKDIGNPKAMKDPKGTETPKTMEESTTANHDGTREESLGTQPVAEEGASEINPQEHKEEITDDGREDNWLDYVLDGAKQREKKEKTTGARASSSIDLSKGGLVKRSANTKNASDGFHFGHNGKAWRNRIYKRHREQPSDN